MPVNQIQIPSWSLAYRDCEGFVGIQETVPPMYVQVDFKVDCVAAALTINTIQLLNADALEFHADGIDRGYSGLATGMLRDGQAYLNAAHVLLTDCVTYVEFKYGLYWALGEPPANGRGIARFAFQGRTGVRFSAVSKYYTQKWTKAGGWDAGSLQVSYTGPAIKLNLTSEWSRMDQLGAHYNCTNTVAMPVGAGHGNWVWFAPQVFQIFPKPNPAAPNR
jgi:hypothetical protein